MKPRTMLRLKKIRTYASDGKSWTEYTADKDKYFYAVLLGQPSEKDLGNGKFIKDVKEQLGIRLVESEEYCPTSRS